MWGYRDIRDPSHKPPSNLLSYDQASSQEVKTVPIRDSLISTLAEEPNTSLSTPGCLLPTMPRESCSAPLAAPGEGTVAQDLVKPLLLPPGCPPPTVPNRGSTPSSSPPPWLCSRTPPSPFNSSATPTKYQTSDPPDEQVTQDKTSELNPYVREICVRAFSKASTLTRHKRIHGERINFRCRFCGKSFSQKASLKMHMAVHTENCPNYMNKSSHASALPFKPSARVMMAEARVLMAEAAALEEQNRHLEAQSRVRTIPTTSQPETRSHHDAQTHQQNRNPSAQHSKSCPDQPHLKQWHPTHRYASASALRFS